MTENSFIDKEYIIFDTNKIFDKLINNFKKKKKKNIY